MTVIAASLLVHVSLLFMGETWLLGWRMPSHAIHGAVEMAGALVSILVSIALLALEKRRAGTSFNQVIACALVTMGVLDGMHALVDAGQAFVWLHSTATFAGGLLFACVGFPARWQRRITSRSVAGVGLAALVFAAVSIALPEWTPPMLAPDASGTPRFSNWATSLNLIGGLLFFVATAVLVRTYREKRNNDDLLFCLHTALFGAAATLFEQSSLWDVSWWGWHLLRLMAYGFALWAVVENEFRAHVEMRNTAARLAEFNAELDAQVRSRTAELEKTVSELSAANRELEEFTHVASHDLREPLRMVRVFAELLVADMGDGLSGRRKQYFGFMIDGATRMQRLIEDLLDYSRAGHCEDRFEPVDLEEVLTEVVHDLGERIREADAELEIGPLPTLVGSRTGLAQIFQNLLSNALKFVDGQPPRIRIDGRREGDVWHLRVTDNGIGIAAEHTERVFGAFKRLHAVEDYDGSGIGLAVCGKVVAQHGGQIRVESEVGVGSTFHVSLPARETSGPLHEPPKDEA